MIPFIFWRVGLALLATLAAFFLSRPVIELLLNAIRSRLDKRVRWIADVQHYMLTYLWWFLFLILVRDVIARYILDLGSEKDEVMQYLSYLVAIPLVLGTFAMRKVVTNLFVRYFKWDRSSSNYDARIFVITESIKFVCVVFILIEIFYIFFLSNSFMRYVLVVGFLSVELVAVLSGFTVTSGNALEAHTHSLMLRLHPTTPAQKMKELVQELQAVLPADANTGTPRTRGRSSATSSAFDATGRPIAPPPPPVRVELHAMFTVKVIVLIDRERFNSLEAAKTEVNLAIIDTIQRLGVNALPTGRGL
ncbi:Potassium/sodium hyperpolarization-activated cyclic nucleotide-gated channel 4 [Phytophthora nicotianae]|uniref:Potassium/sodium hyperpolarization-activated cyclic nucleotide-gated channel 4 n=1 Tax=Phytophthora nicotianae TaxID=4792 RepID=A0A0W8DGU6_PHYNI|nr:Potassium/sodium hyperpolarization-activated cyclic nucleotide-gated channel 4 [Phytophthora nicotianae]